MKTIYMLLLILFLGQAGHAQGFLNLPSMEVPDSLRGKTEATVNLTYFVNNDGKIIAWQLFSIQQWNQKKRNIETLYQDNLIKYYWNAQTGRYEPRTVMEYKIKNTPSGIQLAKKLTPWLEEYVKQTKFYINDSTVFRRGNWGNQAHMYGSNIPLRGGKHRK